MGNKPLWQRITGVDSLKTSTDDELMIEVTNGNQVAFSILFQRYGGLLLGYGQRLMGERARAEDLTQDVWMKVIRFSSGYQSKGHFKAWLFTIARNTAINQLRNEKDWALPALGEFDQRNNSEELSAEAVLAVDQDWRSIMQLVDQLPPAQRAALMFSVIDELSYEEISASLKTTVPAVKSLIFRARQTLQKNLRKEK